MKRTNRLEIKLSDDELHLLGVAAAISHPTAKGANIARAIREAAVEAARRVLASTATHKHVDE